MAIGMAITMVMAMVITMVRPMSKHGADKTIWLDSSREEKMNRMKNVAL